VKRGGVLLAGGIGSRFQGEKPKQFLDLLGRPVLDYSLEVLLGECDVLCVVCHPLWKHELFRLVHWREGILVADGGATRQESVYHGLVTLLQAGVEDVVIHDGARPCLSRDIFRCGWEALTRGVAAIPVLPVTQTVASVRDGHIVQYVDRSSLVTIQTPQFFRFDVLWQVHQQAREEGITDLTDDSQLLQKAGFPVDTIEGEPWNIKITTPQDMVIARAYLKQGVEV